MIESKQLNERISDGDKERAANSYIMSIVAIMAGMPLPIINLSGGTSQRFLFCALALLSSLRFTTLLIFCKHHYFLVDCINSIGEQFSN